MQRNSSITTHCVTTLIIKRSDCYVSVYHTFTRQPIISNVNNHNVREVWIQQLVNWSCWFLVFVVSRSNQMSDSKHSVNRKDVFVCIFNCLDGAKFLLFDCGELERQCVRIPFSSEKVLSVVLNCLFKSCAVDESLESRYFEGEL